MLQQTLVKVVIPYFERFISEFPTVKDLANAKEEKVLSLWTGLGYYSRARNLHLGAKQILQLKKFPQNYSELLKIKGIGPYTAAAISSIAFEERVAVVDGNVIRVITRIFDISEDVGKKKVLNKIKSKAELLITGQIPSLHNQAMMELGALICTPKKPMCSLCPVQQYCLSFKNSSFDQRPVKVKTQKCEPWLWEIYVVKKNNKYAFIKNNNGTPWLKNMWVFPGSAKKLKAKPTKGWQLKHSITKHQIYVKIKKLNYVPRHLSVKWFKMENLNKFGTSSVTEKILKKVV